MFNQNADKSAINLREGYHLQMNNNKFSKTQSRLDSSLLHDQVFLEGKFSNKNKNTNNNYAYNNADKNFNYSPDLSNYYSNPSLAQSDFQGLNENSSDLNSMLAKGENLNQLFYQNNFGSNKPQSYLKRNLRSDINNQIGYPYQMQNNMFNQYHFLNGNNNFNNDNSNLNANNLVDLKSTLENTGQYGENLAKGFFDQSHLNFFSGFRFKEKEKNKEIEKEKEKEKEKPKKQILKEKLKSSLQDKKIRNHPCFNKGYFSKDLNFTGTGNFTDCYKFIGKLILKEDLEKVTAKINKYRNLLSVKNKNNTNSQLKNETLNSQFNKTDVDNNNNNNNNFVFLDNQFKNFKFLFYEKNGTDRVLVFKEKMQFGLLKQKVRNICEEQYSYVIADFTKFNIK